VLGVAADEASAPGARLYHKQVCYQKLFSIGFQMLLSQVRCRFVFFCQTCLMMRPGSEGLRIMEKVGHKKLQMEGWKKKAQVKTKRKKKK